MINNAQPSDWCLCQSCSNKRDIDVEKRAVRCIGKSYLAGWRHVRKDKCKQYK